MMSTTQVITVPSRRRLRTDRTTEVLFMKNYVKSPPSVSGSNSSTEFDGPSLDKAALLELCDDTRTSLHEIKTLGHNTETITSFLEAVLKDEARGAPSLDFGTLRYARLDRLLTDILDPANRPMPVPASFRAAMVTANNLQRMWRARFREQYFSIDQMRLQSLYRSGRLKDVQFSDDGKDDLENWVAKTRCDDPISELKGNLEFEAGHWWLNLACAHQDGIVGSALERPTKGKYGVAALPLLTGREEHVRGNIFKYIREGRSSDMHPSLISQVGKQTRILRGYRLKSVLAPQAGIRYDGLYTIRQYGNSLDMNTETYRLELTLERVAGQKTLEEVQRKPQPSQLDDWIMYKKLEAEIIKQRKGDRGYLKWKLLKEEERIAREHWQRAREFKASLSLVNEPKLRFDMKLD